MRNVYDASDISCLDIWLDVGFHVAGKMMMYIVWDWLDLRYLQIFRSAHSTESWINESEV